MRLVPRLRPLCIAPASYACSSCFVVIVTSGTAIFACIWPDYCCSRVLKPGFWLSQVVLSEQPELNASDPKVPRPPLVLVCSRCIFTRQLYLLNRQSRAHLHESCMAH